MEEVKIVEMMTLTVRMKKHKIKHHKQVKFIRKETPLHRYNIFRMISENSEMYMICGFFSAGFGTDTIYRREHGIEKTFETLQ